MLQRKAPDAAKDLLVEEYKSCRDLIGRNIENIEKNEVYFIGAYTATAVFSTSASDKYTAYATSALPIIIAIIGCLRYNAFHSAIAKIDSYLMRVERIYIPNGYTTTYRKKTKKSGLHAMRRAVWILMMTAGAIFGGYVFWHGPIRNSPEPGKAAAEYQLISN